MGMGILDDKVMKNVPGTTRYYDDPERPQLATNSTRLQCDWSGEHPIILVPQPSNSANDPLNWPLWKRDVIIFILSMASILTTALGAILAANTLTLSLYFERTFTSVALLTGYYLMGVGVAGILVVPSSRIWGKRHLFLLGIVIVILSSIWGGRSRSYKSFLWARIFQGLGTAPFEGLVNAAVGDMYFVHERGKRMAFTNLAVFGGAFFTPILVGKITHTIGWPWTFYIVAIACGACLPFMIFFMPETAYRRSEDLNIDMRAIEDSPHEDVREEQNSAEVISSESAQNKKFTTGTNTSSPPGSSSRVISPPEASDRNSENESSPRQERVFFTQIERGNEREIIPEEEHTFLSRTSLSLFTGRKTSEPFTTLLLRPFPLYFHPAILWACLTQATMIGWTVFIGVILAAIFLGPPLFFDEVKTGYAYTGAFVGAIVGFIIAGGLADWSAKVLTRWNGGIYEPEFRILLVALQAVLGITGLYGFGITSAGVQNYGWSSPVLFFGFEVAGMVVGCVASSLYIVDAHREIAIEAFTCMLMFKNFFAFALTFKAYDWLVDGGVMKTFISISTVQVVVCLLAIPMYVFGKRNRSFFHRHDILRMLHLW